MSIVAISADDFKKGQEIAARAASALGFGLLDRSLLAQVAENSTFSQEDLVRALEQPPGPLPWRRRVWRQALLAIQTACLEQLMKDDLVCHGLGAHLFLSGVSHALRVRILEKIPGEPAKQDDRRLQERRAWSRLAGQRDETDPSGYDLVINLATVDIDQAVEFIQEAAHHRKFQAMTYSRQCMVDKLLASRVRGELLPHFPSVQVQANHGTVVARMPCLGCGQARKRDTVRRMALEVPGVNYVEVYQTRIFGDGSAG